MKNSELPSPPELPRTAGTLPSRRLHTLAGPAGDAADRLLALAAGVPLKGMERSCKLGAGSLSANRLLLGNTKQLIEASPLATAHVELGLPSASRAAFERDWQAANFVYFGFDGTAQALSYRIYLEFPVTLPQHSSPDAQAPALLARGYKWNGLSTDAGSAPTADTTEYWWHPRLTANQIVARIGRLWSAPALGDTGSPLTESAERALGRARQIVNDAIDLARPRSSALQWTYLEVTEPGQPRLSFDLNLYSAGLTVSQIAPALRAAAAEWGIAADQADAFIASASPATLGHVSGGLDRTGAPFLTVYYDDL